MQKILYPQSKGTTLSINMTAKTVRLSILENQNEHLQREHTRAVRAADTRRYETADACWKYNHDVDWENKKIMDYGTNTTTRKIKDTIHSSSPLATRLLGTINIKWWKVIMGLTFAEKQTIF